MRWLQRQGGGRGCDGGAGRQAAHRRCQRPPTILWGAKAKRARRQTLLAARWGRDGSRCTNQVTKQGRFFWGRGLEGACPGLLTCSRLSVIKGQGEGRAKRARGRVPLVTRHYARRAAASADDAVPSRCLWQPSGPPYAPLARPSVYIYIPARQQQGAQREACQRQWAACAAALAAPLRPFRAAAAGGSKMRAAGAG